MKRAELGLLEVLGLVVNAGGGGMCRGELRILLFSIFGAITVMFSISAADVSLFFSGVFVPHSSTH
jgi:hypothetical protein